MSTSVLNQRLAELRDAGLVESEGGYRLTKMGMQLQDCSRRWTAGPSAGQPDDYLKGPVRR